MGFPLPPAIPHARRHDARVRRGRRIMKHSFWLLLFPLAAQAAEHDHSAHTAAAPNVAIERDNSPAMQEARHMNMMMHGDSLNFLVLGEQFEQTDDDSLQWDLQGWLGYDRDRLWFKTEGEHATDANAQD